MKKNGCYNVKKNPRLEIKTHPYVVRQVHIFFILYFYFLNQHQIFLQKK